LRGRVTTGNGQGRHFTQLDWACRQFQERLGIDPFPGTLNLVVEDEESIGAWQRLEKTPGVRIDNPNDGPKDCHGRCYPVTIEGRIDAAIVLPEVAGYSPAKIELIAAVCLRAALGVADGDSLRVEIR
jgi:CTP-dependent riboflavin kinase